MFCCPKPVEFQLYFCELEFYRFGTATAILPHFAIFLNIFEQKHTGYPGTREGSISELRILQRLPLVHRLAASEVVLG